MPTLIHKKTKKRWDLSAEAIKSLKSRGKMDAYELADAKPPKVPKEVEKMSAAKIKTAESAIHGTSTITDGTTDGNVRDTD